MPLQINAFYPEQLPRKHEAAISNVGVKPNPRGRIIKYNLYQFP